ncbi:bifunctional diguanylate cyclase/phosphodiesterase [Thiorhodovibrio winogradskyi]|nr:EAL domain-containing protein [Thiorhodovibrio winogradskyi]
MIDTASLIASSAIATFVIDSTHRVVHWNAACADLTGMPTVRLLGTADQWMPFYPSARPMLSDLIVAQASEEEIAAYYPGKYRRSRFPGAFEAEDFFPQLPWGGRWLLFTAAPLHSPDGKVTGAIQHLVDITEHRRTDAERTTSQRLLTEIIEGNPVPTFVIDTEHRVTHWNRACEIVMGIPATEMIGTREQWRAFYPAPRPVMADLILSQANQGEYERYYGNYTASSVVEGAFEAESFFPHFPGGGRWLFFTAAPLHGVAGEIIGAIETLQDTTERKRAEIAFAESERRLAEENYRTLFNEMITGFSVHQIITDEQGRPIDYRFLDVNPAFESMTGLRAADIVGRRVLEILPNTESLWIERFGQVALTGVPVTFEAPSEEIGKVFEVRAFRPSPGQFAVTFQDVTTRKQAEVRLRLLASVFENTHEGIVITNTDSVIIEVNDSYERITGYQRAELIGKTPRMLKSGHHGPEFYRGMWLTLLEEGVWRGELWNRRKSGELFPQQLTISVVLDDQGHPVHFVGVVVDITTIKRHEAELERIAHYDSLTGLPNRVLLNDRLQQAIAKAQREQMLLAVCFLDVDGFKPVNDNHGHGVGDCLLIKLADRFRAVVRANDTVARLGGDEFIILLADLADQDGCIQILQRILAMVSEPFLIDSNQLVVTASIGVTLFPLHATDTDTLLRQADQAMYKAKQLGKNTFFFYNGDQDAVEIETQRMIKRVERALSDNELVLHYQPKVNMRTAEVVGAEALIRWHHPERGLLPPGEFLPVIEDSDVMLELGDWVIREALRQMTLWDQQGLRLAVSVNVSACQLQRTDFVEKLEQALREAGRIDDPRLEIEITETAAISDLCHVTRLIEACRALGVQFSLDDFGTGYSSLTYLKLLPVQTLKIDKSFVLDMSRDAEDHAIVSGVTGLAKAFDLTVIAEGVESVEHGSLLLGLGCELAQGYGIAPALSPERLPDWANHWKSDPAWSQAGACT